MTVLVTRDQKAPMRQEIRIGSQTLAADGTVEEGGKAVVRRYRPEDYRQQLAKIAARAVVKNETLVECKPQAPSRRKPVLPARRRPSSKKPRPTLKSKHRARR